LAFAGEPKVVALLQIRAFVTELGFQNPKAVGTRVAVQENSGVEGRLVEVRIDDEVTVLVAVGEIAVGGILCLGI
jgi:hypothetical protein